MRTDKEQKLLAGHYETPRVKKVEGQVWREGPCPLSELCNQHRAAVTGRDSQLPASCCTNLAGIPESHSSAKLIP